MTAHAWQRRPSTLSRYALLAYASIVIDASLFPFGGWRDLGLAPYAYLFADWPPRALPFDLAVNAIGYLPLGLVCGLAVHPRLRGAWMIVASTAFCALLSIHLEALQTYLPTRVASKVDVLANVGGGLVGALIAGRAAHPLLDGGRLRAWRTQWFAGDASRGLVLIVLWLGALVYPDAFVLGMGGVLKAFDPAGSDLVAAAVGLTDDGNPVATAARFQQAEMVVAGLVLLGAGLLFQNLLRGGQAWTRRLALVGAFLLATLLIETTAHAFLFETTMSWPPLTTGSRLGFVGAALLLFVATALSARIRWVIAFTALIAALVLVNVYPDNPYDHPVGLAWTRGKLLNFYGLASGLNLVWPYLAIAYLLRHRVTAPKRA